MSYYDYDDREKRQYLLDRAYRRARAEHEREVQRHIDDENSQKALGCALCISVPVGITMEAAQRFGWGAALLLWLTVGLIFALVKIGVRPLLARLTFPIVVTAVTVACVLLAFFLLG